MLTREIPRETWPTFFDNFSREYEDWLVEVEVLGPRLGVQMEARELKLEGITTELEGAHGDVIEIMVGEEPVDHITHTISGPTNVWLEETDDGATLALKIESADGKMTLIRFRAVMLPEFVGDVMWKGGKKATHEKKIDAY